MQTREPLTCGHHEVRMPFPKAMVIFFSRQQYCYSKVNSTNTSAVINLTCTAIVYMANSRRNNFHHTKQKWEYIYCASTVYMFYMHHLQSLHSA